MIASIGSNLFDRLISSNTCIKYDIDIEFGAFIFINYRLINDAYE